MGVYFGFRVLGGGIVHTEIGLPVWLARSSRVGLPLRLGFWGLRVWGFESGCRNVVKRGLKLSDCLHPRGSSTPKH